MDYVLQCNIQTCRKQVKDQACVTSCSHIFCLDCATQLNITRREPNQQQLCPACETSLPNQNDVVITVLNPPEDYKSTVLSGLSPQIIMECAGRAITFWAYQATQEILFHEFGKQKVEGARKTLSNYLDKVINEANTEVTNLREQNTNLQNHLQQMAQKNQEMTANLNERTKNHMRTKEMYDRLKHKTMVGQVKHAAYESVNDTIQASVMANRYTNVSNDTQGQPPLAPPLFQAHNTSRSDSMSYGNSHLMGPPPTIPSRGIGINWNSLAANPPVQTPASTHRQRIGSDMGGTYGGGITLGGYRPTSTHQQHMHHSNSTPQQALRQVSGNVGRDGFAGYGWSGGVKASGPPPPSVVESRPVNRSRVAQRPPSGLEGHPVPIFNTSSTNMFSNTNNGQ